MMSPELIQWILYIPFLVVAVTCGTIFCIKGYRQGLWRALISLGITVVALLLSLFLARLLGSVLSGTVAGMIPEISFKEMGPFADLAKTLVQGLTQDVLAIVFFGVVLFILLIVLKVVGNHIKADELLPETSGFKWGGFGVRLADALVVTLFLLLPLYGTIATYISPVTRAVETLAREETQAVVYLKSAAANPVVALYKAGPTAWVQDGLSGFSVGEAAVDLTDMADLLDEALDKMERLVEAEDEEEALEAVADLNEFLRENLIEEEWFYSIVCEFTAEAERQVEILEDGRDKELVLQLLAMLDLTQEEFEDNGIAVLDFVSYSLEGGVLDFVESRDYADLPEDFYEKFGALLNHSTQSVELKKFIVTGFASELYYQSPAYESNGRNDSILSAKGESTTVQNEHTTAQDAYDAAQDAAWNSATAFVSRYWGDGKVTEKAQQIKEAEAFVIFFFDADDLNTLEAFARHPLFGAASVESFLTAEFVGDALHLGEEETQRLNSNPEILATLKEKLYSYETAPFAKPLFGDYAELALRMMSFAESGNPAALGSMSIGDLSSLLSTYEESAFVHEKFPAGAELYAVLTACKGSSEGYVDISALANLLYAAKNPVFWPDERIETEGFGYQGFYGYSFGYSEEDETASYLTFTSSVMSLLQCDPVADAMAALVKEKGADPLALGVHLSSAEKKFFADRLDENVLLVGATSQMGQGSGVYFSKDGVLSSGSESYVYPAISGSVSYGGEIGDGKIIYGAESESILVNIPSGGGASAEMEEGGYKVYISNGSYGPSMSEEDRAAYQENLKENAAALKAFFGA